jgi:hypothetical protein
MLPKLSALYPVCRGEPTMMFGVLPAEVGDRGEGVNKAGLRPGLR